MKELPPSLQVYLDAAIAGEFEWEQIGAFLGVRDPDPQELVGLEHAARKRKLSDSDWPRIIEAVDNLWTQYYLGTSELDGLCPVCGCHFLNGYHCGECRESWICEECSVWVDELDTVLCPSCHDVYLELLASHQSPPLRNEALARGLLDMLSSNK